MTHIKAPGSQPFTNHEILKVSRSKNVRTGLVLRDTSLAAVIKSLVQYSKTLESSYGASFNEAPIKDTCEDLLSWRFLQCAVEATYRRYVRGTRLMCRCQAVIKLVEKVKQERAASDNAAAKDGLSVTHHGTAIVLGSEKQSALLSIKIAAVHMKDSTKENKTAALFNSNAFYFYVAALLKKLKAIRKKVFSAKKLTFQQFLSGQVPRTTTSSPSMKSMLLRTMSLFSHDP